MKVDLPEAKNRKNEFNVDNPIYLNEDRYENPKEVFKFIASEMGKDNFESYQTLHDVGCATGELIYFFKKLWPHLNYSGSDISGQMLNRAKEVLPDCNFYENSIEVLDKLENGQTDIVTCSGLLPLFDEQEPLINNLINKVSPGGKLYIFTLYNQHPVDVLIRYKDVKNKDYWEAGWNLFSKETFSSILEKNPRSLDWEFADFHMTIDIAKRPDNPWRTWTLKTEEDPRQLINGSNVLTNNCLIKVSVKN